MRIIQISDEQLEHEYNLTHDRAISYIVGELIRVFSDPTEVWDDDVRNNGINPVIYYLQALKGRTDDALDREDS